VLPGSFPSVNYCMIYNNTGRLGTNNPVFGITEGTSIFLGTAKFWQEVLGGTDRLLSFDKNGPHRKRRLDNFSLPREHVSRALAYQ
jgi:hypothetical protein